MAFYWNKQDATAKALRAEWIRTGDKYHQDADGFFFHGGRADDMIKSGGIWVSPVEVEGALIRHPAVVECAVIGVADADGLDKPHGIVVLRAGIEPSRAMADDLRAFVKQSLAPYKCPKKITFAADLPKTATGKLKRYMLRNHEELRGV